MKLRLKEAVSLEYGSRPTPIVSARGRGEVAEKILAEAQAHGVVWPKTHNWSPCSVNWNRMTKFLPISTLPSQ